MRIAPWFFASGVAAVWAASAVGCNNTPNHGTNLTTTFASVEATTVGVGGSDTVASSPASSSASGTGGSGGMGGAMGTGGMMSASSSAMSSSSASQSSSAAGTGGADPVLMETPVHGCLIGNAIDLTGAGGTATLTYVAATDTFTTTFNGNTIPIGYPMCLRIKFNQKVVVGGKGSQGGPLLVSGVIDKDGIATYDKKGPIQPNCFLSGVNSFDPNSASCYNGGTWPCGATGATTAGQCTLDSQKSFQIKAYPFYNNGKKDTQQGALYIVP